MLWTAQIQASWPLEFICIIPSSQSNTAMKNIFWITVFSHLNGTICHSISFFRLMRCRIPVSLSLCLSPVLESKLLSLTHTSSLPLSCVRQRTQFWDRVSLSCPGWPWTYDPTVPSMFHLILSFHCVFFTKVLRRSQVCTPSLVGKSSYWTPCVDDIVSQNWQVLVSTFDKVNKCNQNSINTHTHASFCREQVNYSLNYNIICPNQTKAIQRPYQADNI